MCPKSAPDGCVTRPFFAAVRNAFTLLENTPGYQLWPEQGKGFKVIAGAQRHAADAVCWPQGPGGGEWWRQVGLAATGAAGQGPDILYKRPRRCFLPSMCCLKGGYDSSAVTGISCLASIWSHRAHKQTTAEALASLQLPAHAWLPALGRTSARWRSGRVCGRGSPEGVPYIGQVPG